MTTWRLLTSLALSLIMLIMLTMAAPAAADVTIRQKTSGTGLAGAMAGETVQQIKGTKMRTDQTMAGERTSVIMDAVTRRMILLNHATREAEVHDMATIGQQLDKISAGEIKVSVTPTGQTRQVAGVTCTVHEMRTSVPAEMGGAPMTFLIGGPVCLAQGGPGVADYAAFFKAAEENGLFFGDPRTAQAQPGQAKGLTALYQEMATRGVPYASEIQLSIEGSGPMAALMAKMGGMTMITEVVSIATDAIPDSVFEIPEGYRQKK